MSLNSVLIGQLIGGEEASYFQIAQSVAPILVLATLIVNLAVAVKRLHDIDYSGYFALALLVPLVNLAFTIWVGILPGSAGSNRFGTIPDAPQA